MSLSKELPPPVPSAEVPFAVDKNATDFVATALFAHDLLSRAQALAVPDLYDPVEDFEWFNSGKLDVSSFRGKYIAIWKKEVVASGNDATEVENITKALKGEECRPAIVFIPENEAAIL